MGILSSSVAVSRYLVNGKIEMPINETVYEALRKNAVIDIDTEAATKSVGWTGFENPFAPDFEGLNFVIGEYFVFSLRVDKKSVPAKVLKKHASLEMARRLAESGREYLSREEKEDVREHMENILATRIPATPNVYDIVWEYGENRLWLFSTQKAAKEELETLFFKSFKVPIVPLFPFTIAELTAGLSDNQKNRLASLTPSTIVE